MSKAKVKPAVKKNYHTHTVENNMTRAVHQYRSSIYKKFELMLTRRAKAYSSSGSVV